MVNDVLSRIILAREDPKWIESGAETPEEYEYWSWNTCGMACLKMILTSKLGGNYRTIELAKKCETYGGYKQLGKEIDGLIYQPFCKFIAKEFGLRARVFRIFLTVGRIKREVQKGNHFLVSVSPAIKKAENIPLSKGGHLVLVTGFDDDKKTLFIHNPSGLFGKSQENFEIAEKDFKRFFAGRGVLVY